MTDKSIKECNQKCRVRYSNWNESDLRKRFLEIDSKENPFQVDNLLKEGLITRICAVECGVIEQGWRS
jgi:hypothetical protein